MKGIKNKIVIISTMRAGLTFYHSMSLILGDRIIRNFQQGCPFQRLSVYLLALGIVKSGQNYNNYSELSNLHSTDEEINLRCKHSQVPVWCSILHEGFLRGLFGTEIGSRPVVEFPSRASNLCLFVFAIFLPNSQHPFNSEPFFFLLNNGAVFSVVLNQRVESYLNTSTFLHFELFILPIIRKGNALVSQK